VRILIVNKVGARAAAGTISIRRCENCEIEWAQVRELPYRIGRSDWPAEWDALVVRTGVTRSGLHHAALGPGSWSRFPTRPIHPDDGHPEYALPGPFRLMPSEFAPRAVASWTDDLPFGHEVAAVETGRQVMFPAGPATLECGLCFRGRLSWSELRQGHLFLAPVVDDDLCHHTDPETGAECLRQAAQHGWDAGLASGEILVEPRTDGTTVQRAAPDYAGAWRFGHPAEVARRAGPRIHSTYQPGVSEIRPDGETWSDDPWSAGAVSLTAPTQACEAIAILNHTIVPRAGVTLRWRGNIGSLQVHHDQIEIRSPDHPNETLRLSAGLYEWHHPWPRREGVD